MAYQCLQVLWEGLWLERGCSEKEVDIVASGVPRLSAFALCPTSFNELLHADSSFLIWMRQVLGLGMTGRPRLIQPLVLRRQLRILTDIFYEHLSSWRMEAEKVWTQAWVMVKHTQFLRSLIFWAWRFDLTLGFSEWGIIFTLWSVDPNEKELVELSRTCISAFSFSCFIYFHIVLI